MNYPNDLFELVKSLSKSEKRYVRLLSTAFRGESNLLELFTAIERQDDFNDAEIHKLFAGRRFAKQLPVVKNSLYQLLLKGIQGFHTGTSIKIQLRNMHSQAELLLKKKLYKQCKSLIEKAKALAIKHDDPFLLLEILQMDLQLTSVNYAGHTEEYIKKQFEDIYAANKKWQNYMQYEFIAARLFYNLQKYGSRSRSSKEIAGYKKIFSDPLLKTESKALTFKARLSFYACHSAYYAVYNKYHSAEKYLNKQMALFESNPHQIKEKPELYAPLLYNYILCLSILYKYEIIPGYIEKLRAIQTRSAEINNWIFYYSANAELELYNNTGNFEKGIRILNKIEKREGRGLTTQPDQLQSMGFYFLSAKIYFGAGNLSMAKKSLNAILDRPEGLRADVFCFSKIFLLIIYYESGKQDLLEYALRSTYRYLSRRNKLYKVETIILNFIRRKALRISSSEKMIGAFKELKKELEQTLKNPFEKRAMEYVDIISWLDSKITRRSFADIVKEKAARLSG
jgi:hypothetical protein